MRSSKPACLLAFALAAVSAAGCIASSGPTAQLDADNGSGDIVIELVLERGQLTEAEAWWAQPDQPIGPAREERPVAGLEAIVLKNNVELDRVPLTGTADRAELVWRSSRLDAVATPGDEFEVTVVNATSGASVASFSVEIQP